MGKNPSATPAMLVLQETGDCPLNLLALVKDTKTKKTEHAATNSWVILLVAVLTKQCNSFCYDVTFVQS